VLRRSSIGRPKKQRLVLQGLGLRRLNQAVVRPNTPEIWGMIKQVAHLVEVGLPEEEGR